MPDRPTAPTPAIDAAKSAEQAAREWLEHPCDGRGPMVSPHALPSSPIIASLAALLESREAALRAHNAALRAVLAEWGAALKSPGEGEYVWIGGTTAVQTEAVLADTAAAAEAFVERVRSEERVASFHLFNDAMNEFVENMKVDVPAARETMKRRMLAAIRSAPGDEGRK